MLRHCTLRAAAGHRSAALAVLGLFYALRGEYHPRLVSLLCPIMLVPAQCSDQPAFGRSNQRLKPFVPAACPRRVRGVSMACHVRACACVRACAFVCVRACARARVCVCDCVRALVRLCVRICILCVGVRRCACERVPTRARVRAGLPSAHTR